MRPHSISVTLKMMQLHMPWFGLAQCSSVLQTQFEHNPTDLDTEFKESILSYIQVNTALKALITVNFCAQTFCANLMFQSTLKLNTHKTMIIPFSP